MCCEHEHSAWTGAHPREVRSTRGQAIKKWLHYQPLLTLFNISTVVSYNKTWPNISEFQVWHRTHLFSSIIWVTITAHKQLAVWLSGNALASINVVVLRQTRLVSGWVTVCGRVNHLGMYQPARSTPPSTLCGTVKWVSAFELSNNKWRWWM